MDADHVVALALIIIAALTQIVGIVCVLAGGDRRRPRPTPPPAFQRQDSDGWESEADRYHGSN